MDIVITGILFGNDKNGTKTSFNFDTFASGDSKTVSADGT